MEGGEAGGRREGARGVRKSDTRSPQFVSGSGELISEKVNFLRAHKRTPVMKYELDKGEPLAGKPEFLAREERRGPAPRVNRLALFLAAAVFGRCTFPNYRVRHLAPPAFRNFVL